VRILCFIDCLGSGGAQRQLVTMAKGLSRRGHEVRFLTYHPGGHFLPELEAANISCVCIPKTGYLRRVCEVRRVLRKGLQDVVLAFLEAPSLYAELAGLPSRKWGLVVGERNAYPDMERGWRRRLRWSHQFADAVVANSHANRLMLERSWPGLRPKLYTIYNAVDLNRFRPPASPGFGDSSNAPLRMVVVASYQRLKNMMGLAQALQLLRQSGGRGVVVDWYGATPPDQKPLQASTAFVKSHGLASVFRFHPPIREVEAEYQRADLVGLFSEHEGLPNVVCEGMACGKPIVMSDVCDARHLVGDGKNGYLCDPHSPASIADALRRMAYLTTKERLQMGLESRKRAEQLFDAEVIVGRYERILESASRRGPVPVDCSKPLEKSSFAEAAGGFLIRHSAPKSLTEVVKR
jgi:glycosyltransferase involved in cell wall biosynthesis